MDKFYTTATTPRAGLIAGMQLNIGEDFNESITLTYDDLGRLEIKQTSVADPIFGGTLFARSERFGYADTFNPTGTTTQISSYAVSIGEAGSDLGESYHFIYDENGNITEIRDNMGDTLCRYEYDGLGQLIREDNAPLNKSFVYTYDKAGNITSRTTYPYSDGELTGIPSTVTYTYGNSSWGDQLTAYKGNSITYDAIGNPTQIATGANGGYNLTWQGRRLLNYTGYGTENGTSLSFTYNDDGIRTSKTVNGVTHTYMLSGSQVIGERWGTNVLLYLYDENGSPMGLAYRNDTYAIGSYTYYYFDKNLQGDIVGIYKDGSVLVGTYTYDAWGNFTVYANSTSELDLLILNSYNPFRYRGYYYDVETGLYYLQSRYYNPEWGRFINADGYVATGQGLLGNNMYAYCNNNPVFWIDIAGTRPHWNHVDPSLPPIDGGKFFHLSAIDLLLHWIVGSEKTLYFDSNSPIAFDFVKSPKMNSTIVNSINTYKTTGQTYFSDSTSISGIGEFDLWMGVRGFNYEIFIEEQTVTTGFLFWKKQQTEYIVTVKIYDTYNFNVGDESGDGLGSFLNNIGYWLHEKGIGGNYEWYLTYTQKIKG